MPRFLAYLVLALLLLAGYQWLNKKPAAPPLVATPASSPITQQTPSLFEPSPTAGSPQAGQDFTKMAASVPASSYAALLREINQLIEQGKEVEAEAKLTALPKEAFDESAEKTYAAMLWNNLGILQADTRGAAAGVAALKKAVSVDPANPKARVNLTWALWRVKDPALTQDFLEKTIGVAPDQPLPHLVLADMLYDKDDLAGAVTHLEQATQHAAQNPKVQPYLQFVTAKVKHEAKVEQKFITRDSSHFTVKFDGDEDHTLWGRVSEILEDAYREIGQRFNYYPSKPIMVVLHSRETFRAATGSPAWSDGLFDMIGGRIKVPTQGALTDHAWLTRVLRHEYVHALLHDRMGGRLGAVPTWLNEGLAMQLAGDPWPDLDKVIHGQVTLINLISLEGPWMGFPPNVATVAYLEGNSATAYMIDRYGMDKVREILDRLANGQPIAAAIPDRLFISYEQFQERWIDELNSKIRLGSTSQ
jgi:predicted negative regulator of RcsB-dependent stress response